MILFLMPVNTEPERLRLLHVCSTVCHCPLSMFGGWQEGAEPESIKTVKKAHATAAPPPHPFDSKRKFPRH